MSWSGLFKFLFAPPGTPSYEFGHQVGKALRKLIVEGDGSSCEAPAPKKETPEESFQKLVKDGAFGEFEERKED
jgi:hypothetical protein